MPANFEKCVANGGRIRTKTLSGGRYIKVCFPKNGGPSVAGYVKMKQESTMEKRAK